MKSLHSVVSRLRRRWTILRVSLATLVICSFCANLPLDASGLGEGFGTVTGTVTDFYHLPVANARVTLVALPASYNVLAYCSHVRDAIEGQIRTHALLPFDLSIPGALLPLSPVAPSVMTDALGQYTIENIAPGYQYAVVVRKGAYGCDAAEVDVADVIPTAVPPPPVIPGRLHAETYHELNLRLTPPVLATGYPKEKDGGTFWALHFVNYSHAAVTVVYWMYSCYNISTSCGSNTQASADRSSLYTLVVPAKNSKDTTAYKITPSIDNPNNGDVPDADPGSYDGLHRVGFGAKVSYCFFTSMGAPEIEDDVDIGTWPNAGSCRAIVAPPPSDW